MCGCVLWGIWMKQAKSVIIALLTGLFLLGSGCAPSTGANPAANAAQNGLLTVSLDYAKQSGYATNQFAVWIEDANGAFVKTLFATKFTATGGYQKRPDAIPTWVERSKLAEQKGTDIVSGATPKSGSLAYSWDLTDDGGARVPNGTYRFCVEGTLRWKNSVRYTGEIEIGDAASAAQAEASYHFEASDEQAALTEASAEVGMLGAISAQYLPPEKPSAANEG